MLLRICEMLKQVQHDAGSVQHDAEERKEGGTSRMWYRSLFLWYCPYGDNFNHPPLRQLR